MTRRRGFTLIEVMIALGVFVIVMMGAFMFAQQQIRARKQTEFVLDTEQNARVSLDSIRHDLQLAGLGIGYSVGDVFQGITLGPTFTPFFNSNNFPNGALGNTDDLRIRGATGPVRSVARYDAPNPGVFQVCSGMFPAGTAFPEFGVLVSESYTDAMAIQINSVTTNQACTDNLCIRTGNCDNVNYNVRDNLYQTDNNADTANYRGGTLFRGYFDVLYFVSNQAQLFRTDLTRDVAGNLLAFGVPSPCSAARNACATDTNLLGDGIETLQFSVFEFTPGPGGGPGATADVTALGAYLVAGGVTTPNRLRIDVEVIGRSRIQEVESPLIRMCSRIQPALCFPPAGTDRFRRRMLTTSVELRNSGHMRFSSTLQ